MNLSAEDLIHPQRFLEWERRMRPGVLQPIPQEPAVAILSGTDGHRGRYSVVPIRADEHICWIDPAGFSLATSKTGWHALGTNAHRDDYELQIRAEIGVVERVYAAS